ncbi:hypothetical protein BDQ12DRAFT_684719 [Crucibulum laeve]|uniref:Uncharacterized protein n=1 Tax=Crucibulum laeve TaxID=68775 RepID=A0A5C3LY09_9AGAR|nr:hypothetical protein BDQ12DRAFT_684719 [Crucibulum laeve]
MLSSTIRSRLRREVEELLPSRMLISFSRNISVQSHARNTGTQLPICRCKYVRTFSSTVSRRAGTLEGITVTERIRSIAIIAHSTCVYLLSMAIHETDICLQSITQK